MQSTKLLFFLAVWRRPEITEICFMGLNRLRKLNRYPINVMAVISEESMIPLCEKYDVRWCFHDNQPLGAKKNFGLQEALKLDFDFLIEIGSDDLLKDEYFDCINFDRDVLIPSELVLINTPDGKCKRLTYNQARFAAGRSISRKAIETVNGNLWDSRLTCGLDNNSHFVLGKKGFFEKRIACKEPVVIDLKSDENIWSFGPLPGSYYDLSEALKGLSEEEINAIACLRVSESSTAG